MPEGHVIHRLASVLNAQFRRHPLQVTSPQGRFAAEAARLDGHQLTRAEAWGKHLFLTFDNPDPEHVVWIHLGLIGTLTIGSPEPVRGAVRLRLSTPTTIADLRGPQWCRLITETDMLEVCSRQGADPLRDDANPTPMLAKVGRSRRSIGSLLMDQKLFAGVGNIYRAEVLFRLGISPFSTGQELDHATLQAMWDDLVELMREGKRAGRIDTVRPQHTPEAMGREPRKDDHGGEVYVYRREGQACYVCGSPIAMRVMEGRNLFWCPTCQPTK